LWDSYQKSSIRRREIKPAALLDAERKNDIAETGSRIVCRARECTGTVEIGQGIKANMLKNLPRGGASRDSAAEAVEIYTGQRKTAS
jgi:hypothetical protein